ncbi:hypothetical protein KY328_04630 [Candidatus Woesearchaeota archaeon]|nr:hypothetical protein [Candidatus Woesearchaeota archaeon]MBW3022183.1 hypothetical protein [Candidatus Woesearchaeota archaeon]
MRALERLLVGAAFCGSVLVSSLHAYTEMPYFLSNLGTNPRFIPHKVSINANDIPDIDWKSVLPAGAKDAECHAYQVDNKPVKRIHVRYHPFKTRDGLTDYSREIRIQDGNSKDSLPDGLFNFVEFWYKGKRIVPPIARMKFSAAERKVHDAQFMEWVDVYSGQSNKAKVLPEWYRKVTHDYTVQLSNYLKNRRDREQKNNFNRIYAD